MWKAVRALTDAVFATLAAPERHPPFVSYASGSWRGRPAFVSHAVKSWRELAQSWSDEGSFSRSFRCRVYGLIVNLVVSLTALLLCFSDLVFHWPFDSALSAESAGV